MSYKKILEKSGYQKEIFRIIDGEIAVPDFTVDASINFAFGFPPVLIPLWSYGSWPGYIGIAKQWFGDKPDSFVQYFSESNTFVEIAKDFEQFKAWMVFDFLCNVPEPDEVGRFAESIGFCAAGDVDKIFADCDDVSELGSLDIFSGNLPSVIANGEDHGEPEWVVDDASIDSIQKLIATGDFENAWYQVNSGVFSKVEVLGVLNSLSNSLRDVDNLFDDLISSWSNSINY